MDSLILTGDFNLPSIHWKENTDTNYLLPVTKNGHVVEFIETILNTGLCQINRIFNANDKMLDLLFTTEPMQTSLQRTNAITSPEDVFHPTIHVDVNLSTSFLRKTRLSDIDSIYAFSKTDYRKLNTLISEVDWQESLPLNDLDESIVIFYDILKGCIQKSVPVKCNFIGNWPPWNNNKLRNLKNRKNKLYKKYKKTGTAMDFSKYSVVRSEYNICNKISYNTYLSNIKSQLQVNLKSFYKFVNSKRRSNTFPKVLKFGAIEADDDLSISNMFADFFATTYSRKTYNKTNEPSQSFYGNSTISVPVTTSGTVQHYLRNMKCSYNPGPVGIPSNILKHCANSLSGVLSILFNESLRKQYFPPLWKNSFIIPLFKSGCKSEVTNYRGIAKLSAIPKLLEKIITDSQSHQVSSLLSRYQHGFRKSYSTETNVLELTTIVNEGFRNRLQTDVIYTDFSKAFDKSSSHNNIIIIIIYIDIVYVILRPLARYGFASFW
ncbi:uncharacterized protein LOC131997028 [Stomoxys calcitrans]|uniref:uncharacterized protein LOC131997028 n=1 Tax=Stomoxys calcitrans TaxID=35570 RepID=UPI0027E23040|nr:uncharacterized protein LOC131997028 [Stomoxys calcitrans]